MERKCDIFSKIPLNVLLLASCTGESDPVSGPTAAGFAPRGTVLLIRREVPFLPLFSLGGKYVRKRISDIERRGQDIS